MIRHYAPGDFRQDAPVRSDLGAVLVVAALLAQPSRSAGQGASKSFDAWVEAFTTEWSRGNAPAASAGETPPDADDPDSLFLEGQERRLALARKGLAELGEWPDTALDATQRVSAARLRWHLETFGASQPFADHLFVLRQVRGFHVVLVNMWVERSTLLRSQDVNTNLERLGKVATPLDEGIARAGGGDP